MRIHALCRYGMVAATMVVVGMAGAAARAAQAAQTVKAVWDVQEIFLSYFGLTTYYSCDGLRDKVQLFSKQLGVHENSRVVSAGCTELVGPDRLPGVRLVLATPRIATPEVIAAQAKDPKRSALLAKLQQNGPALETGEFDAIRKTVVLRTKQDGYMSSAGDCELLEHLRDQVIKKMDARIVKDDLSCTPGQGHIGNRVLAVEILAKH